MTKQLSIGVAFLFIGMSALTLSGSQDGDASRGIRPGAA